MSHSNPRLASLQASIRIHNTGLTQLVTEREKMWPPVLFSAGQCEAVGVLVVIVLLWLTLSLSSTVA